MGAPGGAIPSGFGRERRRVEPERERHLWAAALNPPVKARPDLRAKIAQFTGGRDARPKVEKIAIAALVIGLFIAGMTLTIWASWFRK